MDEIKKKIDQTWKEKAAKEREQVSSQVRQNDFSPPEPDFNFFVTTLGLQASIALGLVPNPATNQKEENLNQAKFIIDTLGLLKEKTRGNLNNEEEKVLENLLYELRMQYVSRAQSGGIKR
jgi:hypothetical protein